DVQTGRKVFGATVSSLGVSCIACDATVLVTGGMGGELVVRHTSFISNLSGHKARIVRIVLETSYIVSGAEDQIVRVWGRAKEDCLHVLPHFARWINFDAEVLSCVGNGLLIAAFDAVEGRTRGRVLRVLELHSGEVLQECAVPPTATSVCLTDRSVIF